MAPQTRRAFLSTALSFCTVPVRATPAGTDANFTRGLYSTLDDMLIWSGTLASGKILSTASRQAMVTDYGHGYGLGLAMQAKFGQRLVDHTGNDGAGHASIFDWYREDGLSVIMMTNNTGLVDDKVTLIIDGKPASFQANAARKSVEQVERLYFGRSP